MKHKSVISYYSLIATIIAATPACAGVRVGNLSRNYADTYNQVNGLRMGAVGASSNAVMQNQATAPTGNNTTTGIGAGGAVVELPVRVANAALADKIARGETVGRANMAALDACARIYPDGEFAWDTPTGGVGRGGAQTCIAVVELRAVNADGKGGEAVLARANVAADDAIRCNIDEFPEYGYTVAVEQFEFPADREPTIEDVVSIMNEEQKQNAGLKIAAGALIGGLGGNIVGKSEAGSDAIMGTGKDKMQSTAIGALSGAALMAGNSYAGKVGGDVILSTGVNAAAGGAMGNMMASGNSVLRIEKCDLPGGSCLWGTVRKTKDFTIGEITDSGDPNQGKTRTAYYNIVTKDSIVCLTPKKPGPKDDEKATNCTKVYLADIHLTAAPSKSMHDWEKEGFRDIKNSTDEKYTYDAKTNIMKSYVPGNDNFFVEISDAREEDGVPLRAMIPGVSDKAFGFTSDDWYKWVGTHRNSYEIYARDGKGEPAGKLDTKIYSIDNFKPTKIDAEDGGIIDINNKARLKSTLTGAGIGGAMGGFVGYQGAKSDINERWVSAVREYKDSLTRVYCMTGKRYLGQYNDTIKLPALNIPEEE